MINKTPLMVFISSRLDELKEERNKVEVGISELWNHEDILFKVWDWGNAKEIPSGKSPDRIQSEGIGNSDIYVLILGSEYGDYKYGESPTHKEHKDACSEIKEDCILIYIKEVEDREEKVDRWIKEIKEKNKHTCKLFKNSDELKNLVKIRLRDLWNKRKGCMEVIIKSARHVPELYYSSSKSSCYGEGFDADELSVEVKGDDNSKSFIAFLVTCRIEKNSSKRLFFRFISRDFLEEPEVSIKLTLNHTFGDFEVSGMSKFIEAVDKIKWAKGSSGVSEVPTDPCPQHSEPIPSFGDIDGEIPKM
jgi:hypothetical protein